MISSIQITPIKSKFIEKVLPSPNEVANIKNTINKFKDFLKVSLETTFANEVVTAMINNAIPKAGIIKRNHPDLNDIMQNHFEPVLVKFAEEKTDDITPLILNDVKLELANQARRIPDADIIELLESKETSSENKYPEKDNSDIFSFYGSEPY